MPAETEMQPDDIPTASSQFSKTQSALTRSTKVIHNTVKGVLKKAKETSTTISKPVSIICSMMRNFLIILYLDTRPP